MRLMVPRVTFRFEFVRRPASGYLSPPTALFSCGHPADHPRNRAKIRDFGTFFRVVFDRFRSCGDRFRYFRKIESAITENGVPENVLYILETWEFRFRSFDKLYRSISLFPKIFRKYRNVSAIEMQNYDRKRNISYRR